MLKGYYEEGLKATGFRGYVIKGYMTTSLKAKIEARADFTSDIQNNAINLLKAIQEFTNETKDIVFDCELDGRLLPKHQSCCPWCSCKMRILNPKSHPSKW